MYLHFMFFYYLFFCVCVWVSTQPGYNVFCLPCSSSQLSPVQHHDHEFSLLIQWFFVRVHDIQEGDSEVRISTWTTFDHGQILIETATRSWRAQYEKVSFTQQPRLSNLENAECTTSSFLVWYRNAHKRVLVGSLVVWDWGWNVRVRGWVVYQPPIISF